MKKLALLLISSVLSIATLVAQPTLLGHATFESGLPSGWTVNSSNAAVSNLIASTGSKSMRMQPSSTGEVYLTSPTYTITANSEVRMEFSHIPILKNSDSYAGKLQIKVGNGEWTDLSNGGNSRTSPGDLDVTYGSGDTWSSTFHGFSVYYFWQNYFGTDAISLTDLQTYLTDETSSYYDIVSWRNAVFYLHHKIETGTSFQVRFVIPQYTTALANSFSAGWFIDDIRFYVASNPGDEVRVPQIAKKLVYPNLLEYPNCADAEVTFDLRDNNGALSTIADSLYVEYYTEGDQTLRTTLFTHTTGTLYSAYIPFAGVDSVVYWRAVINDHKNNRLTFPFCYGRYNKFKSIRPYVGNNTVVTSGTSSQTVVINTSMNRAKYQMRYKAQELRAAGFGPGRIAGISMNLVEAAAGTLLSNFKISVKQVQTDHVLDTFNPEDGMETVFSETSYVVPSTGWTYFEFDPGYNFTWDGKSDILISTCYQDKTGGGTTKVETYSSSQSVLKYETATAMVDACLTNFDVNSPYLNYKPNLKFNFVNTCFFNFDAAVSEYKILKPDNAITCTETMPTTAFCTEGTPAELKVNLRNDGTDVLHRILVSWMLDDNTALTGSNTWYGSLQPNDSVAFTITSNFLPSAGQHNLKIWTQMVDADTIDWNYANDTASFNLIVSSGAMNGTYAIGGNVAGVSQAKTFANFEDAFLMMINSGVNGPVTFKVKSVAGADAYANPLDVTNVYRDPIVFPSCVTGISATNTVTFESATPNTPAVFCVDTLNVPVFTLNGVHNLIFKNLAFHRGSSSSVVKLSDLSSNIKFVGCTFEDELVNMTNVNTSNIRLVDIGAANNVTIDSCSFKTLSTASVYVKGLSPENTTRGIVVKNSLFEITKDEGLAAITDNAIFAQYNVGLVLENNTFITNLPEATSSSLSEVKYAVNLQNVDSVSATRNRFELLGTSGLSMSAITNSTIANNMISVNHTASATASGYLCYGLRLLSGNNNKVVYNNVYGTALVSYEKRFVGIGLGTTGQSTVGNIAKNNIVVVDGYGYNMALTPSQGTSSQSFTLSNNLYYKTSSVTSMQMMSYNGANNTTLTQWQSFTSETSSYYDQDPVFNAWNNLNTTNTFLCEKGVSIPGVTTDFYNSARPSTNPCIGAREFTPPMSNVFVMSTGILSGNFDGVDTYTACDLGSESVFVTFKNLSTDTIPASSSIFKYKVNNGSTSTATLTYPILPDSIYTYTFPAQYNFASQGNNDTEFTLRAWSAVAADTIHNNDTATAHIVSLYQLSPMPTQTQNVAYGTAGNLVVSSSDSIYWYINMDDEEPVLKGSAFQTATLYQDTTFYFSRKSEIPVLKISEVQLSKANTAAGLTQNLPSWVSANGVVEISNFGNGDINLGGYKLYVTKASGSATELPTTGSNVKSYIFPANYVLKAGRQLSLLFANSVSAPDSVALATSISGTFLTQTAKQGVILADAQDNVVDAVAMNGATFATGANIPTSVWSGSSTGLTTTGSAGIYRTAMGSTAAAWQVASASNYMTIGEYSSSMTQYYDNGCYGDKTAFNVVITGAPTHDVALTDLYINLHLDEESSCAMGNEELVLQLTNSGISATTGNVPLVCKVYENNVLVNTFTENLTQVLNPFDTIYYGFNTPIDMTALTASKAYHIQVYVDLASETIKFNDTIDLDFTSLVTPLAPSISDTTINYATTATLTPSTSDIVVWYEDGATTDELGRGAYTTPILYETTTYYASTLLQTNEDAILGNGTITNAATNSGYPSPFNSKKKNLKEQYLLRASDLTQAGVEAGNINSLSFNISAVTLGSGQTKVSLTNYNVKMGNTTEQALSTWLTGLTTVYNIDTITLLPANTGWYTLNFNTPFYWDGESNIVVEISMKTPVESSSVKTFMTPTDYKAAISYRHSTTDAATWTGAPSSKYDSIPNMKLNIDKFGCSSERQPVVVTVEDAPSCEVGLEAFTAPTDEIVMSGISLPIEVAIKNYGTSTLTDATIHWSVNGVAQTPYSWTGSLAAGAEENVQIGTYSFVSGAIELVAYVEKDCDNFASNDTVYTNFSACLGNNAGVAEYSVSPTDPTADFSSFAEIISALEVSGVCGPIIFNLGAGTYNEQIVIPEISGTSEENTITFRGTAGTKPVLSYNGTTGASFETLVLENAKHVYFENVEISAAAATHPTVVKVIGTEDIKFENTKFASLSETATTLVSLEGQNLNTLFVQDTFSRAKYMIVSAAMPEDSISANLSVTNCFFNTFTTGATILNSYENVTIANNKYRAYDATIEGTAISFNNVSGVASITGNDIFVTNGTKARTGINVKRSSFTMMDPLMIYNNAVAVNGITGSTAIASIGIDVDSTSFAYLYFNSVRLKPSTNSQASVSMRVGAQANNVIVRNNNFENAGKGFAYYVNSTSAVTLSNNNNYYVTGTKFAYWGANIASLDALQAANSMDGASVSVVSPFESDSLLKIQYPTDIVYGAEPIEEISIDIEGNPRPVSPHPTMGAYEYVFPNYDAGITEIISPVNSASYIEGDPINVSAVVKNFGSYSFNQISVVANLKSSATGTVLQTITGQYNQTLVSLDEITYASFNGTFTPPLNTPPTDSLYVEVYTILNGDTVHYNDTASVNIKVIPAYNIYVQKTNPITERCNLYNVQISAVIQNKGEKVIDNTNPVHITYEVEGRPDMSVTEQIVFPYMDPELGEVQSLQKNATMTYVFNQTSNFYPLGNADTTWKVRTYTTFDLDHMPSGSNSNDTSAYITITSRRSPNPPITYNDTIYYGTYGHPHAEQDASLPIKWFYNATDPEPFYAPSNYNSSKIYTTPARVFHDSTFYLRVNLSGTYACESAYEPVSIIVRDRAPVDMAALNITAPLSGLVYTEEDTIMVKLVNYGTQAATNFNVTYSIVPTTPADATPVEVTETCTDVVQPDEEYVYKFTTLADMSDASKTYKIRAWVKATGDVTELNDTTLSVVNVKPLNGKTIYPTASVTNGESLDIVRVQMGTVDNASIAGSDTYSNFTESIDPIVVYKGTTDSLIVYNEKAPAMEISEIPDGWMKVYIDWNRDGVFDTISEIVYSDTVRPDQSINRIAVNIPANNISGKTRMRIMLAQGDNKHEFIASTALPKGEIEDYMLNIRPIEQTNGQLLRFESPEKFVSQQSQPIKVRLRNAGKNDLSNATITWTLNGGLPQSFNWTGNLSTSQIQDVTLSNAVNLEYGNNSIHVELSVAGDNCAVDDTLDMNVFLFKKYTVSYEDNFDGLTQSEDYYPYELNPTQPTNCWQMGTPGDSNTVITSAYSEPNCWKTNINGKYPKNNRSILYSPVFDIELIKPDTLAFMMRKALGSAHVTVEYSDYRGAWQRLGSYGTGNDADTNGYNWYNSEGGFTGSNNAWQQVYYSLDHLLTNMGTTLQLRFIFESGNANPTEGIAIDNIELRRGLRPVDAGVTAIQMTPTALPNYGSLFYPQVTIHNYGTADLTAVKVCYMSEDMHIPTCEDVYMAEDPIIPGGDYIYTFESGHYLDVSMPDPFALTAFTRINQDLYQDNDTTSISVVIGPLEKDAAIVAIESPTTQIVSNDDIIIGIRVRNYGLQPITELPVAYSVSGGALVNEVISFNPPLYNGDEYVYRFNQTYHASYGTVNLKTWVGLEGDYYHDNDTLYKRLEGTNYTKDLEAKYITIDDADPNKLGVQLAFMNRSSVGVGDITVGYYLDGDMSTKVEETYRAGSTLTAGEMGYHMFRATLPRRVYTNICAYVSTATEVNRSNDTTCALYMGYRDGVADSIFIEQTVEETCLIQLVGHNAGTLGGATTVRANLVVDGDWNNVIRETFTWNYDEPNPEIREYMTFSYRIPKSENGRYNVLAWIEYPADAAHWNDTTTAYQVKSYVGLDEVENGESGFVLEQNSPNPVNDQTTIGFTLPTSGNIQFYVTNTIGQVIYTMESSYSEGHHNIDFDASKLEEGVYYYVMTFNGEKQMKKMIIVR